MSKPAKIYVPCDMSARSVGADEVAHAIEGHAKQNDLSIDIIRNGSRGLLYLEPMVEIEIDGERYAYGNLSEDQIPDLFAQGWTQKILSTTDHKSALGRTEDIPYLARQERLTFARLGLSDPLDLEAYRANDGLTGLERARETTPENIAQTVLDAGLRGRGGAGFPTGIKWQTAAAQNASKKNGQKYICANADEGDSGTFADRMLMEGDPFCLIEGLCIGARAIGASIGYVYIRSEYPHAIHTMKRAVDIWQKAGLFDGLIEGDDPNFTLHIRTGAGAYICGEESSMLESLEGKRGEVKVKPPIPAISGLFDAPTIINNVLTLGSVPIIMAKGSKFYADFGQGRSRGTQAFQLSGDIARSGLVESAFGISLDCLINDFGGGSLSGRTIKTAQLGGPLGAYVPVHDFDVEMDYEALADRSAMLGHGGVVVFNESADMADMARFAFEFCAAESCGKCTPCRIGAVRGQEAMEKIIDGQDVTQNMELITDLCELMEDASLCAMGGLTPMPVRSAMMHFADEFTGKKLTKEGAL